MCRNITPLRGLMPHATDDEITAAAVQFVRKVGSISSVSPAMQPAFDNAVAEIAVIVKRVIDELPERKVPPATLPPLRRRAAQQS